MTITKKDIKKCIKEGKKLFKLEKVFYILRNTENGAYIYTASRTPSIKNGKLDYDNGYFQKWKYKSRWAVNVNEQMITTEVKTCLKCSTEKSLKKFHKSPLTPDGFHTYCKTCRENIHKEYTQTENGKERVRKASERYRQNKDKDKKDHS